MPKVTGPVFSLSAAKSLKKTITYQKRLSGHAVYPHSKPGAREPFTRSEAQRVQRNLTALKVALWKTLSAAEKEAWDDVAEGLGYQGTGYHYYISKGYLEDEFFQDLIGYWDFNKGSGCEALDLSIYKKNGVLLPSCPTNSPIWVPGQTEKFGHALELDGVDEKVEVSGTDGRYSGLKEFSIEVWAKFLSRDPLQSYQYVQSRSSFMLWQFKQTLRLTIYDSTGAQSAGIQTVGFKPSNDVWYYLVGTGNHLTGGKLYIDGVFKVNTQSAFDYTRYAKQQLWIGASRISQFLHGHLDEPRLYRRQISQAEITRRYQLFRY